MANIKRIAILHGGGPAPGSAAVFEGAVTRAGELGIEIFGVPFGFSGLRKGDFSKAIRLTAAEVKGEGSRGGTFLPTHRASLHGNESYPASAIKVLTENGVEGLIVVGGEDSGSSAFVMQKTADATGAKLSVVHSAKTIDGDIYHPENLLTFGVDTAAKEAARDLVACRRELVSGPDRSFLMGIMGRSSGELARIAALEAEKLQGKPDIVIVPEVFEKPVPIEVVRNLMTAAILKSRAKNGSGAVILCSEGVAEKCTEESIKHLIAGAPVDDHGHIQHSRIQFAFNMSRLMEDFHAEIGLESGGKPAPVTSLDVGYGRLRCGTPSEFDREYGLTVGREAADFLNRGEKAATLFYRGNGKIHAYPFSESVNQATNRMRSRPMDLQAYRELIKAECPFISEADLKDARLVGQTKLSADAFASTFSAAAAVTKHLR